MVRICKNGKKKYKSLGISVNPAHWDFKKNLPKPKCPNYATLLILINEKISEIQRIILNKKVNNVEFTATTLLQSTDTFQSKPPVSVGEGFLSYIQALKNENRLRYAGMFEVSYSSFIKFNKHLDIPFSDIDVAWLKKYEQWMKSNHYAINTIGTDLDICVQCSTELLNPSRPPPILSVPTSCQRWISRQPREQYPNMTFKRLSIIKASLTWNVWR